jgi:signal transduction histidine kinase
VKRVEKESLLKSFFIYFISMGFLIGVIYYINYKNDIVVVKRNIFNEMKVCSFDLKCTQYDIKFVKQNNKQIFTLYENKYILFSYFNIPKSIYLFKIIYKKSKYNQRIDDIFYSKVKLFFITLIFVFLLSLLFSFYALRPLRKSLTMTNEFIRDILHDLNTPITSLLLNIKMILKTKENYNNLQRMEQSIDTILFFQDNLKAYLGSSKISNEDIDICSLVSQKIENLTLIYSDLTYNIKCEKTVIFSHKISIDRILNNLLSNASKYNIEGGFVEVEISNNQIIIKDSGKGIENTKYIFDRFYKEHSRGMGIGLHIVKRLCNELDIKIDVQSKIGVGSTFTLSL